jgi:hypothetical protein
MARQNGGAPLSERERAAQRAYFAGQQAQDAAQASDTRTPFYARPIPPAVGVTAGFATAAVAVAALVLWPTGRREPAPPAGAAATAVQTVPMNALPPPTLQVSSQMFVMTPTAKRLKDIREGAPFRADMATVESLRRVLFGGRGVKPASAADRERVVIETDPPAARAPFHLVRKGGTFYLCAYTRGPLPPTGPGQGVGRVTIYNSAEAARSGATFDAPVRPPNPGGTAAPPAAEPAQVLVPLGGLGDPRAYTSTGRQAMADVDILRLDAHARDPWLPLPAPEDPSFPGYRSMSPVENPPAAPPTGTAGPAGSSAPEP